MARGPHLALPDLSLVPRPFSEKSTRGLATRNTLPCQGIQSVTQAGVNVYTLGVAVSVLCLACGNEALPHEWRVLAMRHYLVSVEYWDEALPCECRVLNSANSQLRWKLAVTEAPPVASI